MIHAEKKALGGFMNMKKFIKCCWADGGSLESKYMKTKKDNIKIEVLVVRKEYQHLGMKHVNTRTFGEKSYMYDLVR